MPLFGKSKKAQDAKKQEETAAPKQAAYRHVPKHAASDARNHGLAESDRTAQQKRIMAASQSRLNSMNSNYSVKNNFNEVPIKGSQSKPFVFTASSSPRQSIGSVTGKDRSAVQPGTPASAKAQEEYVKLRNPSLLSNTTATAISNLKQPPAIAKNQPTAGGIGSSDSGYGSSGYVSRPDSNAPSTASKAPSDLRHSQDPKAAPQAPASRDFLPKLDFSPGNTKSTPPSEPVSAASYATKSVAFTSQDRRMSTSSSYVSRLDPGSDRRSIASFSSKPFDQVDFSKPVQQITPAPLSSERRSEPESDTTVESRPQSVAYRPSLSSQNPVIHPDLWEQSPMAQARMNEEPKMQRSDSPTVPHQQGKPHPKVEALPEHCGESIPPVASVPIREEIQHAPSEGQATSARAPLEQFANRDSDDIEGSVSDQEIAANALASESEEPQPRGSRSTNVEPSAYRVQPIASSTAAATFSSSTTRHSQDMQSEQSKMPSTRHRNWSRPSQSSGSQLDYDRSGSATAPSVEPPSQPQHASLEARSGQTSRLVEQDLNVEAEASGRSDMNQGGSHAVNVESISHTHNMPQNVDQASSIYGESTYNPSTRQHSPSRRHSLAPSEVLGPRYLTSDQSTLAPLEILDGLKVNKKGKILDEEGDPIGELVEGDIIDCVRQKANAFGQVLDDYGRVVGRVVTISRGGDTQIDTVVARSRGFTADSRFSHVQRYAPSESHLVSPIAPPLGKPFEHKQEEDPRQRAADLQAAAARRNQRGLDARIELDASGYAEAAPIVDHSEIFAPPFIPSRSPKRSPAEPAPHTMDSYFKKPAEKDQFPPEETPRLKKWASRNLEQDREKMQTPKQAPPVPPQPPSDHTISRPSTKDGPPAAPNPTMSQDESDSAAQDFISSDQPKDIFPWMTNPGPQGTGKWNSSIFTYGGEAPKAGTESRQAMSAPRSVASQPQSQSQPISNNATVPKQQRSAHLPASAGSRKSNRTSYQHQPHVKSPLSTHNIIPPDTSENTGSGETPRPSSHNTNGSGATDSTAKRKTYFTHNGRTSVMVSENDTPDQTTPASVEPPPSPLDAAVPPDVVRAKADKKKSRWSIGFGKKAPPVQHLLKKT